MKAKKNKEILEKHRQFTFLGSNVSPESRTVMSLNDSTWDRAMKTADGDRLLSDVSWTFHQRVKELYKHRSRENMMLYTSTQHKSQDKKKLSSTGV